MDYLFYFIGFGLASLLAVYIATIVFPRLGLLDFPERYGKSREKIPYPGGLVLFFIILGVLLWKKMIILALLTSVIALISFIDDRKRVHFLPRLIVQLGIALCFAFFIEKIDYIGNPFGSNSFQLPLNFAIFLTVIWIVAIQNAMNWFDGLEGLCTGVAGIGFLALGVFGLIRPEVVWEMGLTSANVVNFSIAGILLGSWLIFFRGKILLGDTGSQIIGFLLAVFSIIGGTKIATTLLILGLPMIDFIIVVSRRVLIDKKSPFQGDVRHLHHLVSRKVSEKKAVLLFMIISAAFAGFSVFLTGAYKLLSIIILFIIIVGLYLRSWQKN